MSGSLLNKSTAVLNAIAITTALAITSGYLPSQFVPLTLLESVLQAQLQNGQR